MEHRVLGRTGRDVSVIGLGCWQLGADWGEVSEEDALAVLHAAADNGVTFFDTADVYGDGRSEQVIGRFLRDHDDVTVVTPRSSASAPGSSARTGARSPRRRRSASCRRRTTRA